MRQLFGLLNQARALSCPLPTPTLVKHGTFIATVATTKVGPLSCTDAFFSSVVAKAALHFNHCQCQFFANLGGETSSIARPLSITAVCRSFRHAPVRLIAVFVIHVYCRSPRDSLSLSIYLSLCLSPSSATNERLRKQFLGSCFRM